MMIDKIYLVVVAVTFDQLEALEAIVAHGSFKAAAAALNKTQPTLSVAIKKLEDELELLLFDRDEYRATLTPAGKVFAERARETLRAFRSLAVAGRELGRDKVEPSLTVVVDPVARLEAVAGLFDACLRRAAPTELTLRSEILGVGADLLRSGAADFAVAPYEAADDDLESIAFERVEMVAVVRRSLLGKPRRATAAWLAEHPQIIVTSGGRESHGVGGGGQRCFVTDHSLKRRLIVGGFGWGRLARHELTPELLILPPALAAPFVLDLRVMRSRLHAMGPTAKGVWQGLIDKPAGLDHR